MHIVHRIGKTATEEQRLEIERLGVNIPPMGNVSAGFIAFDVSESHESWSDIREWIVRTEASDFVRTEFTKEEIAEARWLALEPEWHHGYPQPHPDDDGYLEVTYDLTDCCEKCRSGRRQKAPFVMKGEPRWGRRGILQLNWVFDEYFATPEVWAAVFEPHGVGSRPVLNNRGAELRTVVQLVIEERVSLRTGDLAFEKCPTCGRVRYLPIVRGPVPPLLTEPSGHIARTTEWFGSGGSSFNLIVVSQVLARAIQSAKVRGAAFKPVAAAGSAVDR